MVLKTFLALRDCPILPLATILFRLHAHFKSFCNTYSFCIGIGNRLNMFYLSAICHIRITPLKVVFKKVLMRVLTIFIAISIEWSGF
jgi:hypothetical protein